MTTKLIRLVFVAVVGIVLLGCEQDFSAPNPTPKDVTSFTKHISSDIMHQGQQATCVINVTPGVVYQIYIENYNDGDADLISVYAYGTKLGTYRIPEKRMGGNGWYRNPYDSPAYQFTATNDTVNIMIKVDVADSWGTWPEWIHGAKVEVTNGVQQ